MIDFKEKEHYTYEDLLQLVHLLRQPDGCPWDSAQNHHSIRRCFLEEVSEACEAIDREDPVHLQEELGDVLYQVVFHADLEREAGRFDMEAVIDGICHKLVARHPFLFQPEDPALNADMALNRWEERKQQLNGYQTVTQTMDAVCRTLPALWRAEKLCKKAAKVGYGPADAAQAAEALAQTHTNLQVALATGDDPTAALGEMLFAAADLSAHVSADPEAALHAACEAYIRRFAAAEDAGLLQAGIPTQNRNEDKS